MQNKPIVKLKLGWDEVLKKLLVPHHPKCTCGCKVMARQFKSRVKELNGMIARGEAVIS